MKDSAVWIADCYFFKAFNGITKHLQEQRFTSLQIFSEIDALSAICLLKFCFFPLVTDLQKIKQQIYSSLRWYAMCKIVFHDYNFEKQRYVMVLIC